MSTTNAGDPALPETATAAPNRRGDDPFWRALQYRWLSTDPQAVELGLVETCGSRHDVDLVVIQVEQGYWAGDFDDYGRGPSWLRRLQAREDRRRGRRPGRVRRPATQQH
jgi:hypothetical protein